MEYSIFKDCLIEALKERMGEDCSFEYKEVLKNNGVKLDGLLIKNDISNISPTIYVNDYYKDFVSGEEIEEIAEKIESMLINNSIEGKIDVDSFMDYENVKEKIVYKVINYDKNKDLLKTVPHNKFLDLAIVYLIYLEDSMFSNASILISDAHLKLWNKTKKDIEDLASKNTPDIFKVEIKTMADTLNEILHSRCEDTEGMEFSDCGMYVMSNEQKQFGAATLLYKNSIKELSDKTESDIFIIPSSVHELILIPANNVLSRENLDEMIKDVNATEVPLTDILSDHAYIYSRETDSIGF